MKIKGKKIDSPNIEVIILPRGNGEDDIIFKAQAVLSFDDFDKLCPKPKAPIGIKPGGIHVEDVENKSYKLALDQWATKRTNWLFIQSLRATDGLEFEKVKYDDPSTWELFEQELIDSKFSEIERQRIMAGIWAANSLNESRLEEARQRFLLGQLVVQGNTQSCQKDGQKNTQSGEPVKDSN